MSSSRLWAHVKPVILRRSETELDSTNYLNEVVQSVRLIQTSLTEEIKILGDCDRGSARARDTRLKIKNKNFQRTTLNGFLEEMQKILGDRHRGSGQELINHIESLEVGRTDP